MDFRPIIARSIAKTSLAAVAGTVADANVAAAAEAYGLVATGIMERSDA
jgi:hypothetical protein